MEIYSKNECDSTMNKQLNQQLIKAILAKDEKSIKDLLASGADPNYADEMGETGEVGMTALLAAIKVSSFSITKLLLEKGMQIPHSLLEEYSNPYEVGPYKQNIENMLENAVKNKNDAEIKILLDLGIPIDADDAKKSPMLNAAYQLLQVAEGKLPSDKSTINGLLHTLQNSVHYRSKAAELPTPLHLACKHHNKYLALCLINAGASVHAINRYGGSPFTTMRDDQFFQSIYFIASFLALPEGKTLDPKENGDMFKFIKILLNEYDTCQDDNLKHEIQKFINKVQKKFPEILNTLFLNNLKSNKALMNIVHFTELDPKVQMELKNQSSMIESIKILLGDPDIVKSPYKEAFNSFIKIKRDNKMFDEHYRICLANETMLDTIRKYKKGDDLKKIQELFNQKDIQKEYCNAKGENALIIAYQNGNYELVEFLLKTIKVPIPKNQRGSKVLALSEKFGLNCLKRQMQIENRAKEMGSKAANLKELDDLVKEWAQSNVNTEVPPIFPLTHETIYKHIQSHAPQFNDLWRQFKQVQSETDRDLNPDSIRVLNDIRHLITTVFISHPIDSKELEEYITAQKKVSPDGMLMIRSTGKEDTVEVANPGGNESVAAVPLDSKVISEAIGVVVASYFSEKSLKQRLSNPVENITEPPFIPVLVQKMIGESIADIKQLNEDPDRIVRSGVMYTSSFGTRIDVAPGHGELVVNSKAPFDTYYVTREQVVHSEISPNKRGRLVPEEVHKKRTLGMKENPKTLKTDPSISSLTALKLAKIGQKIEEHYAMPMDVEFVYYPKTDQYFIVQARPKPEGDAQSVQPSSVPPHKQKEVSQKGVLQKVNVITGAGNATKVITHSSQILIAETVEEALHIYLSQKESSIKVVIVKNIPPATSHATAQFSTEAIPVIQMDDSKVVSEWLNNEKPVVIVDPQQKCLIEWSAQVKNHGEAEKELFHPEEGILQIGLFESSMKPQVTLLYDIKRKKAI